MTNSPFQPTVLTLAGSDGSGGAGLQADLKTISALQGYALTVPTAITAQNSRGVHSVHPLPAHVIKAQLQAIFDDYQPHAIKMGMLANHATIEVILTFLQPYCQQHPHVHVVVDPVLVSSSGRALLEPSALDLFIQDILPLSTVLTPNLPEVNRLLNAQFKGQAGEIEQMAHGFFALGVPNVLIKGGHSIEPHAIDYLVMLSQQGTSNPYHTFTTARLNTPHTHGTGCTLASALATELAKGQPLINAVQNAKTYLFNALSHAHSAQPRHLNINNNTDNGDKDNGGHGGLNHFYAVR